MKTPIIISIFLLIATISFAQDCPPLPPPPGNPDGDHGEPNNENKDNSKEDPLFPDTETKFERSKDPNEIIGLTGYDSLQWVSAKKALAYTIYYENDPDFATAAAQLVNVRHKFHTNADSYTLQLGNFGFGEHTFNVPPNSSAYKERLDLRDSLGIFVDVTAGLDVVKNEAFWILQSIDPETGLPPAGTEDGFLPVNDSTGKGEGFMLFYVTPNSSVITGDTITAEASIVFDDNDSIPTNIWKNSLDALPPTTQMSPLPPQTVSSNTIQLHWTAQDDPGGVGVSHFDLLVAENNGTFYLHKAGIDTNYYEFTGKYNTAYQFSVAAYDFVGNQEEPDLTTSPVSTYTFKPYIEITAPITNAAFCQNEVLQISWNAEGIDTFLVDVSADGGNTFINADSIISSKFFNWDIPSQFSGNDSCLIRISNPNNTLTELSSFFRVLPADTVFTELRSCSPDKTGIDTLVNSNQYGCNIIEIVTTLLSPTDLIVIEDESCQDEPYIFNGITCDTTGNYIVYLTNQYGCDSIVHLNLVVNPSYTDYDTVRVCEKDLPYIFGTQSLTQSGDYSEIYQSVLGCDSTIMLKLIVDECPEVCINLKFNKGWNIFSVNNIPDSTNIETIFQPLIENGSLVKIRDESGNSLEDWGIFGGWKNSIGDIYPTEGYKIKVNFDDSIEICGSPIEYPFAIQLQSGWNIMSYPQTSGFDGMNDIVQQLIDRGTLIKVQDEGGNTIEDWGIYGGWTNNIIDFIPGEGYKIKVNADEVLWIYDSYSKSSAIVPELIVTTHFSPEFEGNGVDHMNINLVELPINVIKVGDELAIFDGETCVGGVTIMPHHIYSQTVSIAASAADGQGVKGFNEGNPFILRLWRTEQNQELKLEPEILKGSTTFIKHESTVASLAKYTTTGFDDLLISSLSDIKCYPNPFSKEITIEIKIAEDSEVQVEVLNQIGQKVKTIATKSAMNTGKHSFVWNGENNGSGEVVSGVYYIRVHINNLVVHRKIILLK